jgi:hypothetical protein
MLSLASGLILLVYAVAAGLKSANQEMLHPLRAVGSDLMVTRDVTAATVSTSGPTEEGPSNRARSEVQQIIDENSQIARIDLSKLGPPNHHFVHDFFMPGNQLTFPEDVASGVSTLHSVKSATGGLILIVEHQEGTVPEIVASFQTGGEVVTIDQAIAPPTAAENQATQACIEELAKNAPPGPGGAPGKPGPPQISPADLANCLPVRLRHFHTTVVTPVRTITQVLNPPETDIAASSLTIAGVDVDTDQGFLTRRQMSRGGYFTSASAFEAVVNESYAAQRNLDIGSHIVFNGLSFEIVGLSRIAMGIPPADVYVPLHVLQKIANLDRRINFVFIRLNSSDELGAVTQDVMRRFPGMMATGDKQLARTVNSSLASIASLAESLKLALVMVVSSIVAVMNCFLAVGAVRLRVREFGTLRAIGWNKLQIVRQVILESLVQAVLGVALGLGLGIAAIQLIPLLRLHFDTSVHVFNSSGVIGIIPTHGASLVPASVSIQAASDATGVALGVCAAIVAGVVSGCAAGLHVAWLRPMQALREIG